MLSEIKDSRKQLKVLLRLIDDFVEEHESEAPEIVCPAVVSLSEIR